MEAAAIPHDMPKTHSWHKMEWLCYQQAVADTTNFPSILSTSDIATATCRHSIFRRIRRLPDCTHVHMALKFAVNTRSGDKHPITGTALALLEGHGQPGRARLCATPDSLLLMHGLLLRIGQLRGHYDPQRVTCSSEWVSFMHCTYPQKNFLKHFI